MKIDKFHCNEIDLWGGNVHQIRKHFLLICQF